MSLIDFLAYYTMKNSNLYTFNKLVRNYYWKIGKILHPCDTCRIGPVKTFAILCSFNKIGGVNVFQ